MKNFIKLFLLTITSVVFLVGCGAKKEEETISKFINKMLSVETYKDFTLSDDLDKEFKEMENKGIGSYESQALIKFSEDSKVSFGEYFTEDGFLYGLTKSRIVYMYYSVIDYNNVKNISDIEIVKNNEKEYVDYIHYVYEISYKLETEDKSIDMVDNIEFKINKETPSMIKDVYLTEGKSNIIEEYYKITE